VTLKQIALESGDRIDDFLGVCGSIVSVTILTTGAISRLFRNGHDFQAGRSAVHGGPFHLTTSGPLCRTFFSIAF
jgi:hypothetical protein